MKSIAIVIALAIAGCAHTSGYGTGFGTGVGLGLGQYSEPQPNLDSNLANTLLQRQLNSTMTPPPSYGDMFHSYQFGAFPNTASLHCQTIGFQTMCQ